MFSRLATSSTSVVRASAGQSSLRSIATAAVSNAEIGINTVSGEESEASVIEFPRPAEGNDYELNWSLCDSGVTPQGQAFRNQFNKEASKPVKGEPTGQVVEYNYGTPRYISAVAEDLSASDVVYAVDGKLSNNDIDVRVVTNSARVSNFASMLMDSLDGGAAADFNPDAVAFVTQNSDGPNPPGASAFKQFSCLYGTVAGNQVRNVVAAAAAGPLLAQSNTLTLKCDAVVGSKNNTALVFAPNNDAVQQQLLNGVQVVGAHHNTWGDNGVTGLWSSTTALGKGAQGDYTETLSSGDNAFTSQSDAVQQSSPQSIIFLVNDDSNALPFVSKLTASQAADYYSAGYLGQGYYPGLSELNMYPSQSTADRFGQLVDNANAVTYVVNASMAKQSSDIQAVVASITNGDAASESTSTHPIFANETLKSIKGVAAAAFSAKVDDKAAKELAHILSTQ